MTLEKEQVLLLLIFQYKLNVNALETAPQISNASGAHKKSIVEQNLQDFFDSKKWQSYRRGIFMLPDMWLHCIDSERDYFDY